MSSAVPTVYLVFSAANILTLLWAAYKVGRYTQRFVDVEKRLQSLEEQVNQMLKFMMNGRRYQTEGGD